MNKRRYFIAAVFLLLLCASSGISSYLITVKYFNKSNEFENNSLYNDKKPVILSSNKINSLTNIIYEYEYSDGNINRINTEPPDFMIGLTFDDLIKYYPAWEIVSFSPQKVVMRKKINEEINNGYTVLDKNGVIAVYFNDES